MSNKLQVGDFVKVVNATVVDKCLGVQVGGIYRVSRVAYDAGTYIETIEHPEVLMSPTQYVEAPPIPQNFEGFKVGDTVERTFPYAHNGMYRGMRSVVTSVAEGWVTLANFPGVHSKYGIKVVARAEPTPVPKRNDGARLPSSLPNDSATRKEYPLAEVLFGQFPAACVAVAHHSYKGNQKHNPGKPLQDNRSLSNDDASCIMRHLMEGDYEGVAWRAMRLLQKKLEAEGAPVAPLATFD